MFLARSSFGNALTLMTFTLMLLRHCWYLWLDASTNATNPTFAVLPKDSSLAKQMRWMQQTSLPLP